MKSFAVLLTFLGATAAFGADQSRSLTIRSWSFEVPTFLTEHVQEGPDFTVTYLISKERKMSLGIYEGGWPQNFAKGKSNVRKEKDEIAGQEVVWSLWEEDEAGNRSFHAEVFLRISPTSEGTYQEVLHIFVAAASSSDLDSLRHNVRSAHRSESKPVKPTL